MTRRSLLIVGNWKMNGTRAALSELKAMENEAVRHPQVDVVICPPATLIERAAAIAAGIEIGAQDCHAGGNGAFTGRLSPAMLRDAGAKWVILGHSECRAEGETDETVRAKAAGALAAGLAVIICVGEAREARDRGEENEIVLSQLIASLPDMSSMELAVAYEPVWAIGTGQTPTLGQIEEMHAHIRSVLIDQLGASGEQIPILYGGSASAGNSEALLSTSGVDGLLVGGASLTAGSFVPIIDAAARCDRSPAITRGRRSEAPPQQATGS